MNPPSIPRDLAWSIRACHALAHAPRGVLSPTKGALLFRDQPHLDATDPCPALDYTVPPIQETPE